MTNPKISSKQINRFKLIETIAFWERTINANILKEFLGLTWNMAIKELTAYRELHPEALKYNGSIKLFSASDCFQPHYISTGWEEYHQHLLKYASSYNSGLWHDDSIDTIALTFNSPDTEHLRAITQAIKSSLTVKTVYSSMNNPKGLKRVLHPHALAFDGRRWHIRAFSESHDEFRDFNLSRFKKVAIGDKSQCERLSDNDWHSYIEMKLDGHPELNQDQKKLVLNDYKRNKPFTVKVRAALMKYFITHHNISIKDSDDPISKPLFLKNAGELSKYLY